MQNSLLKKVFWLTGVSGVGKTTLAQSLWKQLNTRIPTIVLDADLMRYNLWPELDLSLVDRSKNVRRLGYLAYTLIQQLEKGIIIIASIAPYKKDRLFVQELLSPISDYHEIYICASLEERIKRDPKGLYQKAMNGQLSDLTGYNGIYEEPESPAIVLNTDSLNTFECTQLLIETFLDNRYI